MAAKKRPAKRKPKPAAKAPAKKRAAKAAPKTRRVSTRAKQATAGATKARGDAAAARAKAAGATKAGRLPAVKTQLRNSMILARKAQGLSNVVIAAEAGVTERTIERILAEARRMRSPLEDSPMELLEELARGFRLAIGDYEAMALGWFDTNQSASLGAKKAADETRIRLATLLHDLGKLPENLETFRSEMEMQRIAQEMVTMMRAVAAGERDAAEAVEFFRGLLGQRDQAVLPAGA